MDKCEREMQNILDEFDSQIEQVEELEENNQRQVKKIEEMLGVNHRDFSSIVQSQDSLKQLDVDLSRKIAEQPDFSIDKVLSVEGVSKDRLDQNGRIKSFPILDNKNDLEVSAEDSRVRSPTRMAIKLH